MCKGCWNTKRLHAMPICGQRSQAQSQAFEFPISGIPHVRATQVRSMLSTHLQRRIKPTRAKPKLELAGKPSHLRPVTAGDSNRLCSKSCSYLAPQHDSWHKRERARAWLQGSRVSVAPTAHFGCKVCRFHIWYSSLVKEEAVGCG